MTRNSQHELTFSEQDYFTMVATDDMVDQADNLDGKGTTVVGMQFGPG
jgi:hypothetical protein